MKTDGSSNKDLNADILSIRFHLIESIDYLIEESVYYRNFSEDINVSGKIRLFNFYDSTGKCKVV